MGELILWNRCIQGLDKHLPFGAKTKIAHSVLEKQCEDKRHAFVLHEEFISRNVKFVRCVGGFEFISCKSELCET